MLTLLAALVATAATHISAGHPVDVKIVVGHGLYQVEAEEAASDAWVQFSIPIAYRGQTPLAEVVTSDPPDRVLKLSLVPDAANRYLRVYLRPLATGDRVLLRANTFVLVRREDQSFGDGVALAAVTEIPPEVKRDLEPAPGVDAADPRVQKIAKGFARRDLKAIVDDLFEFLSKNVKDGSGPQGAVEVLERGSAESAGQANLAAALLIAAKVPTRILPCIMIGAQQQEHYIIEAWTPKLGWSKIETTTKTFPLDDSKHLILRFVDSTTKRSGGSVPLYGPIVGGTAGEGSARGVKVEFGGDEATHAWQSAEAIETTQASEEEVAAIESAARKALEALTQRPSLAARAVLVPKAKAPPVLKTRGKEILERLERRLDG